MKTSRTHHGFAVVDLLVVGMVASTAAAVRGLRGHKPSRALNCILAIPGR